MSIQAINSLSQIQNIQNVQQLTDISKSSLNQVSKNQFGNIFEDLVKDLVGAELSNAENLSKLASGDIASITQAMVGFAESDLTIKFTMEIRNKLVDAYKEIMQMQV